MGCLMSQEPLCAAKHSVQAHHILTLEKQIVLKEVKVKSLLLSYQQESQALRKSLEQQSEALTEEVRRNCGKPFTLEHEITQLNTAHRQELAILRTQQKELEAKYFTLQQKHHLKCILRYLSAALKTEYETAFFRMKPLLEESSEVLISGVSAELFFPMDGESLETSELNQAIQLFQDECEVRLNKNPILQKFNSYNAKFNERPMAAKEFYRWLSDLLDMKYKNDLQQLKERGTLRPMPVFTLEYLKRHYGLKALGAKALCQMVLMLQQLYNTHDMYGTILCRLLQIFHKEPAPDALGFFLVRARVEFLQHTANKETPRAKLTDAINVVYSLFESDRLCRGTAIKLMKPPQLSVEKYLIFRICHKLTKLGETPEKLFNRIDCEGTQSIHRDALLEGVKSVLELAMPSEDVQSLFDALDGDNSGTIERAEFLTHINFNEYTQYTRNDKYTVSLSEFLLAMINTFKVIQIKDSGTLFGLLAGSPNRMDFEYFKKTLNEFEAHLAYSKIEECFEEALALMPEQYHTVSKEALIEVVIRHGLGGRGIRDFRVTVPVPRAQRESADLALEECKKGLYSVKRPSSRCSSPAPSRHFN